MSTSSLYFFISSTRSDIPDFKLEINWLHPSDNPVAFWIDDVSTYSIPLALNIAFIALLISESTLPSSEVALSSSLNAWFTNPSSNSYFAI